MLEQELKNIWNNSSQTAHISIETSQLLNELNAKMTNIEKVIRIRDIREIAASVIGILIFMYLLYEIPFPLTKIGCVLSILWFCYLIFKLKNNKKQKQPIDMDLSLSQQLDTQKANMLKEAKLLNTVLYWYVLPPFIANVLFIWGFGNPVEYNWFPLVIKKLSNENMLHLLPISLKMKFIYLSGILLFNVFVVWINKRAASKDIKPIIEKIERIKNQFETNKNE